MVTLNSVAAKNNLEVQEEQQKHINELLIPNSNSESWTSDQTLESLKNVLTTASFSVKIKLIEEENGISDSDAE